MLFTGSAHNAGFYMIYKLFADNRKATLCRNDKALATAKLQRSYWLAHCERCNNLHRNGLSRAKALALIVEHCIRHHDGGKHESTDYGK